MRARDDVIVVGAGPAGSIAALILARAGARVRLLDRSAFPRPKLCGDTLNPGARALLQRLEVAEGLEREALAIRGMRVTGPGRVEVTGDYPAGQHALSIRRERLDWHLLCQAIDAGARFEPFVRVRGAVRDDRGRVTGVRVERTSEGTTRSSGPTQPRRLPDLAAPVTIAADGRHSTLAFSAGLAWHPLRPRRWAIGAYFDRGAADTAHGEMHVRQGAYIGVAPVPSGLTNACLVVSHPHPGALADPAGLLVRALRSDPVLAGRFAEARLVSGPAVLGPMAVESRVAGADGLLLAGDAAGFLDPMTGDGLYFAFRGAELAAAAALDGLDGREPDAAGALLRQRRQAFGGKWRMNRALRALVGSPAAVSMAAAAARACPAALRAIIAAAGDVPRDADPLRA